MAFNLPSDFNELTVLQLKVLAAEHSVHLQSNLRKQEIKEAIQEAANSSDDDDAGSTDNDIPVEGPSPTYLNVTLPIGTDATSISMSTLLIGQGQLSANVISLYVSVSIGGLSFFLLFQPHSHPHFICCSGPCSEAC